MFDKDMMRMLGWACLFRRKSSASPLRAWGCYGIQKFLGWETPLPLVVLGVCGMTLGMVRAYRTYSMGWQARP